MPAITPERIQQALNMKPKEALEFLYGKESVIYETFKDIPPEMFAKIFTVSGVLKMDILEAIRAMIERALEEGMPFEEWKKEMLENEKIAEVLRPSRLQTIYRTNLQSAFMAARYKQQLSIAEDKPFWKFVAVMDASTTTGCRDLDGKVFRYDDSFWSTNYPPRHYNCRSRVVSLNERELKRYGGDVVNGDDYKNVKPDESFAAPPDQPFKPNKKDYSPDIWNQFKV